MRILIVEDDPQLAPLIKHDLEGAGYVADIVGLANDGLHAASTIETWVFGSPPNSVEAPENSFEFEVTWAWTSSPITISQSPVAPFISLPFDAVMPDHLQQA